MIKRSEQSKADRQTQSGPKHHKRSSDLRRRLKAVSDVDEVTLDGRLFHTREAATGNAQSPMVEWRIGGTTSVDRFRPQTPSLLLRSSTIKSVVVVVTAVTVVEAAVIEVAIAVHWTLVITCFNITRIWL